MSGDIGLVDEDGFIHITARLSRFSKIGGEMVPHLKIEESLQRIIDDKEYRDEMVDFNYEIGKAFFSYSVLRRKLRALVTNFTGQENL